MKTTILIVVVGLGLLRTAAKVRPVADHARPVDAIQEVEWWYYSEEANHDEAVCRQVERLCGSMI